MMLSLFTEDHNFILVIFVMVYIFKRKLGYSFIFMCYDAQTLEAAFMLLLRLCYSLLLIKNFTPWVMAAQNGTKLQYPSASACHMTWSRASSPTSYILLVPLCIFFVCLMKFLLLLSFVFKCAMFSLLVRMFLGLYP